MVLVNVAIYQREINSHHDKKPIKWEMGPGRWRQKVILKDNISQEIAGVSSLTTLVPKTVTVMSNCGLLEIRAIC